MSMTANKVLDRAEDLGMLDPKVIGDLRRQVAESKFHVTAEAIVKLLVDKKHLTPFQAKKLVAEANVDEEPTATTKTPELGLPTKAKPSFNSEDDLLAGFGEAPAPSSASKPAEEEEIVDLEEALPPSQPLKAELKPIPSNKPPKSTPAKGPRPPGNKPPAWKTQSPPQAASAPGLTPIAPTPGLTPIAPAGLAPISPAPAAGLTPLAPATGVKPPGLTPGDRAAPAPAGLSPMPSPPSTGLTPMGPSPLGSADPMLGDALGGGLGSLSPPPPPPEEKAGRKKNLARRWDSPLFLMGYAGLGVLAIAFIALYLAIFRGSAAQLLADANDKYEGGQYGGAIALYEKYAKSYPDEASVPYARLMIRASRIHQPYDGKDYNAALKVAQHELPEMEKEAEVFDQFRGELESILPTIADHFASAARTATDQKKMEEQVALARAAMQLVNNASYLPTARRESQQARIDDITEKIRVAERTINQGKALADAMASVQAKIAANDIKGAYDARAKLLQDYPTLQSHAEVVKNTLAISQRERDLVTTEPQTQPAATDDPHLPPHRQLALVQRSGEAIGAPEGAVSYLLIRGTVYAIDVAPGKLLWQRSVGAQTVIQPVPIGGGDVIVSDQEHREVLRLAGKTGNAIWRQSFGEAFSAPQPLDDHLFVTLESGRVLRLNAANGEIDRAAQLPQSAALAAAPVSGGTDAKGKVVYQPAEHSTIFALAADDSNGEPLSCRSAYYLGHRPGSIVVPPMVVVGYVFVFQNEGASSSLVHALAVKKNGTLESARDPIRLRGRVTTPPVSLRSRLIVVSDLGDILVADVDPGNTDSPINITAHKPGGLSQATLGYPVISGSRLFVADTRLAEYEIVATKQDLDSKQSSFPGDAFVAPLQMFANTLVHARQRPGAESTTVTGINLSDNKTWEIVLSAPVVGVNVFPQQKLFAGVSSDGELFEVGVDSFAEHVRDQPAANSGTEAQVLNAPLALPDGRSLFWTRSGRAWALQDARAGGTIQRVVLQADEGDRLAAKPAAFGGGVLAPVSRGAVWLLDPATGAALGGTTPFLPETAPNMQSRWLTPLVVDERQFVAVDAARKAIYLVRREEKPTPYLAQSRLMEVDYEPAFAALLEKTLLVVARGETEDEIVALSLPSLQETKRLSLKARVGARGLEVAGSSAFCQTSSGDLLKISAAPELVSSIPLGPSLLAAAPLAAGNDLLLVARNGRVLRMSGDNTAPQTIADAGQPLTGAVQLVSSNLLAGGMNGTLHVLPLSGAAREEQP